MTTTAEFAAELIRTSERGLASAALARLEQNHQELLAELPVGFASPRDDVRVRLQHLAAAVEFERPELFAHSVQWYAVALRHRGVADAYLHETLGALREALDEELPKSAQPIVSRMLDAGREALTSVEFEPPSHLEVGSPHGRLAGQFLLATLEGRGDDAVALVRQSIADGMTVAQLHDEILVPVQRETGRMWLMGEIQIAEEHFSSQVVDRVLWAAQDSLAQPPVDAPRVLLMGTSGDVHSFGLRMIAQRLQAEGLRVHNLGPDMPAHDLEAVLGGRLRCHRGERDDAAPSALAAWPRHGAAAAPGAGHADPGRWRAVPDGARSAPHDRRGRGGDRWHLGVRGDPTAAGAAFRVNGPRSAERGPNQADCTIAGRVATRALAARGSSR